ncbi:MAG TPA: carboxypeptidase-like regulatory domain-containing protein [Chthonomonadaceae bacterium]|nr:carboxypeptidase-like regulatory domain-containing protein [Chthonomonadaceae bacterium]
MPHYRRAPLPLTIACCLLSLIAGCGGGGSGVASLSRVSGKAIHEVSGGPCCNPPSDTPLQNTLLSFHTVSGSTEVARARTDAAGDYSVILPPGSYAVDLVDRASQPSYDTVAPSQIPVTANAPLVVDIKFELHAP